jgi:ATP-dependent Lon protease
VVWTDGGIMRVITGYTKEAGLRNMEREIGTICRKIAVQVAEGKTEQEYRITDANIDKYLGPMKHFAEELLERDQVGVATGLAWTAVGGDILFIEATAVRGKGKLSLTGQLGEVMKESAQAALSYVRGHLAEVAPELPSDWFKHHDIHIHVPAGAIPKDGPSAGITMATALVSLLSGRHIRDDVAMTGEMTLTGQVLPIGGLKDKALAAQRNGIAEIIAPELNEADTDEIPEHLRSKLSFHFVEHIADVLEAALEPAQSRLPATSPPRRPAGRNGDRVYARARPKSSESRGASPP